MYLKNNYQEVVCYVFYSRLVSWPSSMKNAGSLRQLTRRWWRSWLHSIQAIPSFRNPTSVRRPTSACSTTPVGSTTSVISGCLRTWIHSMKMSSHCCKSRLPISRGPSGKMV